MSFHDFIWFFEGLFTVSTLFWLNMSFKTAVFTRQNVSETSTDIISPLRQEIVGAVSIPVMAKCRIGHFVESQAGNWGHLTSPWHANHGNPI